jgi:hypothetical protein
MIWLDIISDLPAWVAIGGVAADSGHQVLAQLPLDSLNDWSVLAQTLDTDPFRGFRELVSNFFDSGQAWAFLAGVVFGYLIRSLTSYG